MTINNLSLTLLSLIMSVIPGTYLPETYNFTVASIVGLVIIVLIVGVVIGNSRSSRKRRKPE